MRQILFNSLKKYLNNTNLIKQMSETSVAAAEEKKVRYNGKIKKRNWEERRSDQGTVSLNEDDSKRVKVDEEFVRIKRRKCAMLLGYSGVNYYGMQRNPEMKTIEEDLISALYKTDMITKEAYDQVQTIQFQRAARTDKGVSAARQLVSLKLPEKVDINAVNKELPEQIKIFSVKRVTKGFNSKTNCDARTYMYLLPTLAFAKYDQEVQPEEFRIESETINKVNVILKSFLGTKNFHNFTSRKNYKDPSAMRYIISFECEKPFIRKNIEFAVLKIKGQSFMLHQIRKMVGLTIAIIRGLTTPEKIVQSYTQDKLDIPMAPGLGLVLDEVHYDRYNKRYGDTHQQLEWSETEADVQEFKEKYIYPTIIDTEINEKSMILWLETLPRHSFNIRTDDLPCDNEENAESDDDNCTESDIKHVEAKN